MVEAENQCESKLKYNFMSWDISTTGTLLCDEFFHFTCFFTDLKYEVFVMPYRDLTRFASAKYSIYITTEGLYRYLRRSESGKTIKTKTEYFALLDFLCWLKAVNNGPIILTTFEHYQFAPFILIQALKRYDLLDQFKELVHGFAHAFSFIRKKCRKSMQSMNLRSLGKVLLNQSIVRTHDSFIRARVLNQILFHLCNSANPLEVMNTLGNEMQPFIKTVEEVEQDLEKKMHTVKLQTTLKPIFIPYFKGQKTRKKALSLRKQLIDANFDYSTLDTMWKEKGRDLFKTSMNDSLKHMDDKSREDVISMLVLYFESLETKIGRKKIILPQEDPQSEAEGSLQKTEGQQTKEGVSQPKAESSQSKKAAEPQPKAGGTLPKTDDTHCEANGKQPHTNATGMQPKADATLAKAGSIQPKANGTQPKADGTQPKAVGIETKADGTEPKSEGPKLKAAGPNPKPGNTTPKAQGSTDENNVIKN